MFQRLLTTPQSSFLLLGPRGSGKSTWLKTNFKQTDSIFFDLLDPKIQRQFMRRPESLETELLALPPEVKWVVIDEIQKIPRLLDVVHRCIENKRLGFKFALTGSSARKLKRGAANLLAGRADSLQLFPLTSFELKNDFSLEEALNWGTLPGLIARSGIEQKREFLNSYSHLYLKEEIQQEQIVRRLEPFDYFLEAAAQSDGKQLNFSKIAKDVGIDTKTAISFFRILEDTLMGFMLKPYHRSLRKRQKNSPKFYFFDLGVRKTLEGNLDTRYIEQTSEWGRAFESWVINEAVRLNSYLRKFFRFSFLSVPPTGEIDLVIEKSPRETILVEIKGSSNTKDDSIKHLVNYRKDFPNPTCYLLSTNPRSEIIDHVRCMPWDSGLHEIFLDAKFRVKKDKRNS